jgi:DNA-binding NarL/FixJ family response regulator
VGDPVEWAVHMLKSVLIVDDSQVVRDVLRDFFEALKDWKVAGEADDGVEAIQKAREVKPDLILLDFSMPKMNGLEAASVLKKILPNVHIIVFTMFADALGSKLSSAVDLVVPKAEGLTVLAKALQSLVGTAGAIRPETSPAI